MSSILSNRKKQFQSTPKECQKEFPTNINSGNHIGIYPYLYKFKNSIFSKPEYNHASNHSEITQLKGAVYISAQSEIVSKDKHLLYIDGKLSDNFDTNELFLQLASRKPTKSYVIIPKSLDFNKVWWIDRLVGFSRGQGNQFWIVGESRLSAVDLRNTPLDDYHGYKPIDYPFSIRDIDHAEPFIRNGNLMNRCVPHMSGGGGHICYGNYQVDVMDALDKKKYDKLIAVLIEFSSRFKYTDGYGRNYKELMERIPRTCCKCGTKNAQAYYFYNDKTYCKRCYILGECIVCEESMTIADVELDDNTLVHSSCLTSLRTKGISLNEEKHCKHCESEKYSLYYTSPTTVVKQCDECKKKYRFVHLVRLKKRNGTLTQWEKLW